MDDVQFDGLARTVGVGRRATLKGLLGISLGLGLGQATQDESGARKRRKKGKGKGKGKGNKGNTPPACQRACADRTCGDDGCGGSCGTCPGGQACNGGTCGCATPCGSTCCGAGQICVGNQCWADDEEMAFLTLINQYRSQNGKSALSLNTKLGRASELHSQDQAAGDFSGHTGSNGSTPEQRIVAQRYQYSWSGENVFWSIPDGSASAAFTWWKGSPDHNANMLSANFTEIGIGRAHRAANNRWFWTTNFGCPA
jgi:uncharacterized protein YkwD